MVSEIAHAYGNVVTKSKKVMTWKKDVYSTSGAERRLIRDKLERKTFSEKSKTFEVLTDYVIIVLLCTCYLFVIS